MFRIIAEEPGRKPVLDQIMEEFNAIQPDLFAPMKKIDAISATISEDFSWEIQCDEIKSFLSRFSYTLESHRSKKLCYHLDVGITDYEDIGENIITSYVCELDLLKALVDSHVHLEFSYYDTK